jgi:hypothetical protein
MASSRPRKRKTSRKCRPPRLKADKRRNDPAELLGVSPVTGERAPFAADYEGETFTKVEHEPSDDGKRMVPKPGRPRIPIEEDDVRKVGLLGCTDAELAAFFAVSERTVQRRKLLDAEFCRLLAEGRAEAKMSVRRTQMVVALEKQEWRALEWLGRNWLGQKKDAAVDGPGLTNGKTPLLDTLERMEKALDVDAEHAPAGDRDDASESDDVESDDDVEPETESERTRSSPARRS